MSSSSLSCRKAILYSVFSLLLLSLLLAATNVAAWPANTKSCCKKAVHDCKTFLNPTTTCGSRQYDTGFFSCQDCAAGFYCPDGWCPVPCGAGTYSGNRASSCSVVPRGYRANAASEATGIVACTGGFYQDQNGQTSCKACSAGRYSTDTTRTSDCQFFCDPGRAVRAGSSGCTTVACACVDCNNGQYSTSNLASSCTNSPPGHYANTATRATQVIQCARHHYQPGSATTSCLQCPAGTYTTGFASTSLNQCLDCPAGERGLGAGLGCTPCLAGTYKAAAGRALSCETADPGYFVPASRATQQLPVQLGYYQPADGAPTRLSCAAGHTTSTSTASSPGDCFPCPRGTYLISVGVGLSSTRICQRCARGLDTAAAASEGPSSCVSCRNFFGPGCTQSLSESLPSPTQSASRGTVSRSNPSASDSYPTQHQTITVDTATHSRSHELTGDTASSTQSLSDNTASTSRNLTRTAGTPTFTRSDGTGTDSRHRVSNTTSESASGSETLSMPSPSWSDSRDHNTSTTTPSLSRATPTPSTSRDHNTSTVSYSVSRSGESDSLTHHKNTSTVSVSESQNSATLQDSHSASHTVTDSAATATHLDSKSVTATFSRDPTNATISETHGTASATLLDTHSETKTIQVFPPPPPLGLSAASQRAIAASSSVMSVLLSGAAAPAALSMSRGLAVLALIGCPEKNPEDGKAWDESLVPFPASLLPGVGTGEGRGRFSRGAIISFLSLIVVAFLLGLVTTEAVGAKPDVAVAADDAETVNNDGESATGVTTTSDDNNSSGDSSHNNKAASTTVQLSHLMSSPGAAAASAAVAGSNTSTSSQCHETPLLLATSPSISISPARQAANAKRHERMQQRQLRLQQQMSLMNDNDHDEVESDACLPTGSKNKNKDSKIKDSKKKTSSSDKKKEEDEKKDDNNKKNGSTSSSGGKKVSKMPLLVYMVTSGCLGLYCPQAGLAMSSSWAVGDLFLSLGPLVAVFALHIYMSMKLHRSINSPNNTGVFYAPSMIIEDRQRSVIKEKHSKKNVSSSTASPSLLSLVSASSSSGTGILLGHSAKSILESVPGRFLLLGDRFWTRQRGRAGTEAQTLLTQLGGQLQRFRGPKCDCDWWETANPFLAKLDGGLELDESVLRDWENVEVPKLCKRECDCASNVTPHTLLIVWFLGAAVGMLQGIGLAHPDFCPTAARIICALNVLSLIFSLWLRPFVIPFRNYCIIILDGTVGVCSILAAALLVSNSGENDAMTALATTLQVVTAFVGMTVGACLLLVTAVRFALLRFGKCRVASMEEVWGAAEYRFSRVEELVLVRQPSEEEIRAELKRQTSSGGYSGSGSGGTGSGPFSAASFGSGGSVRSGGFEMSDEMFLHSLLLQDADLKKPVVKTTTATAGRSQSPLSPSASAAARSSANLGSAAAAATAMSTSNFVKSSSGGGVAATTGASAPKVVPKHRRDEKADSNNDNNKHHRSSSSSHKKRRSEK